MRAAWFKSFGTAESVLRVGDLERPTVEAQQVLVRLYASGINPSDVKKRAGSFPNLLDEGLVIPNSDGAGSIEAVGEGVSQDRVGERVWVYQAQYARRFGTAAEYVTVTDSRAPRLPDNVSFNLGACLGIPVMTAHRAVFADGPVAGQIILVTGGAGRVGHYAIQWASQAGARVIATASNEADVADCLQAGAAVVVNHRAENFSAAVLDAADGKLVDRIVEVEYGANIATAVEVLQTGGTIATYSSSVNPEPKLPFFKLMYKDITTRFVIVYAMPEAAKIQAIADIEEALKNDRLQHRIAKTLPLNDIISGNQIVETSKTRGAVVLSID